MAKSKGGTKLKKLLQEFNQEKKLAEAIKERHHASEDYLRHYQSKWQDYYQIYRCIPNENYQIYEGRADLYVPYGYSTVETVFPRLTANQPRIIAAPRTPSDLKGTKPLQTLIDYWWEKMRARARVKLWVKDGLMYGTGVNKLTWKKDDEYDGPCMEVVDLAGGEIYFDPENPDLNDPNNWWIHEYEMEVEDILDNPNFTIPENYLIDEGSGEVSQGPELIADYYKEFREFVTGKTPQKDPVSVKGKLWEFWGKVNGESRIVVILNEKFVIRNDKNPYKHGRPPFVAWVDTQVPHIPLGIGEIEPIERLQYELNDVRNQRMDNVTQILHRMWKIHKGADIDETELVWRPNGVVHTDMMEGLLPIEVPDVTKSSYNEETLIKQDIQTASGVTDYARGMGNQSGTQANETARGIAMMQEVANVRFQAKLSNLEDAMVIMGEMLIDLLQQFLPRKIVIRITGEEGIEWREFSRKEIQGNYDVKVEMGATQPMNRLTRRADARDLIATVAPYLANMPNGIQRLDRYLNFLEETYDMPPIEEKEGGAMAQPGPQPSTPGQPGPGLAPMEEAYGQIGKTLGGTPPGQKSPEIRRLSESA